MRPCKHPHAKRMEPLPFFNCVAPHDCNESAHGNIVVVEWCPDCGQERRDAVNGRHVEAGGWLRATGKLS